MIQNKLINRSETSDINIKCPNCSKDISSKKLKIYFDF